MATRHQITCVNKADRPNPHERILSIGGKNADGSRWQLPQEEAIKAIEANRFEFYVVFGGSSVNVIVSVSRFGNKYLRTAADGEGENNLLYLPECG